MFRRLTKIWSNFVTPFISLPKMKFNLFFYGIGFLIIIFCNQFIKDLDNDRNYQNLINQRNQEINKILQDI